MKTPEQHKEFEDCKIEDHYDFSASVRARQEKLDMAHMKVMQDIDNGNYKKQTASEHIKELVDEL